MAKSGQTLQPHGLQGIRLLSLSSSYHETLLNLLIISVNFFYISGDFIQTIISFTNRDNFTSFLAIKKIFLIDLLFLAVSGHSCGLGA